MFSHTRERRKRFPNFVSLFVCVRLGNRFIVGGQPLVTTTPSELKKKNSTEQGETEGRKKGRESLFFSRSIHSRIKTRGKGGKEEEEKYLFAATLCMHTLYVQGVQEKKKNKIKFKGEEICYKFNQKRIVKVSIAISFEEEGG